MEVPKMSIDKTRLAGQCVVYYDLYDRNTRKRFLFNGKKLKIYVSIMESST